MPAFCGGWWSQATSSRETSEEMTAQRRVVNFPLPTYPNWENGKLVGKWDGKMEWKKRATHLNVRLRYIEIRKIDVGDRNRCIRREVYIYSIVAF
jgi:hypothetical protein